MEPYRADLVVIGAGAAGLLAAAAARRLGDEVVVVETSELAGGTTATSDGQLWLPANPIMAKAGIEDSILEAGNYLNAVLGEATDPALAERRLAFLKTAPKLTRWLASSHVPLHFAKGVADNHRDLSGFKSQGRVIQAGPIDRRLLGESDALFSHVSGLVRDALAKLPLPRRTASAGESLVAHLLHRSVANGVELWLESTATQLLTQDGRVTGVLVDRAGVPTTVLADRVLLAGGGFEANAALRDEHLPLPTDSAWTTTTTPNRGDLLRLATSIGAASTNLADAWWTPVVLIEGQAHRIEAALQHPNAILVDAAGDRYTDETRPSYDLCQLMYDHSRGVRAVPSFLIMDNRHRQSCQLGPWAPGSTPRRAIENGEITRANTINDLAQATGLDRAGVLGSVVRFNNFAAKGSDTDFNRGALEGTGKQRKNPALGKIDKPPFWAVKVYPGDTGTKGGLTTDAACRVLRSDSSVIEGLYACAGTASSIFAGGSPAPGAALSEALVAAFLAVTDQRSERRREL